MGLAPPAAPRVNPTTNEAVRGHIVRGIIRSIVGTAVPRIIQQFADRFGRTVIECAVRLITHGLVGSTTLPDIPGITGLTAKPVAGGIARRITESIAWSVTGRDIHRAQRS